MACDRTTFVLLVVLLGSSPELASAEPQRFASPGPLRQSVAQVRFDHAPVTPLGRQLPRTRAPRAVRGIIFTAIGAVGGFFGGGYLGASIEGNRCHCDDPGLQGFLIGAPIGAVVGGVIGWKLAR